jgi:DNA primase
MPGIDFAIVRSSISLAQVLELVGFVPLRRAGHQLRGPCPMRRCIARDGRSFSANLTRNQFQCFKCGAAGSQLELWAFVTHQTVYAAAIDLCHRLGIDVPWMRRW